MSFTDLNTTAISIGVWNLNFQNHSGPKAMYTPQRDESQKLFAKGDTDIENRLSDSVGGEQGGTIWEHTIETSTWLDVK